MNNWDAPNPPNTPYTPNGQPQGQQGYTPPPPPPPNQQYQPHQAYQPYQQQGQGYAPSFLSSMSPQDRATLAIVLEVVCGLFGLLGIGWLIAGDTQKGIFWLVGYLIWVAVAVVLIFLTFGLFAFCFAPIHLATIAVSTVMLYNRLKPRMPTAAPY